MGYQRWPSHTPWHEPGTFRQHCVQLAFVYRFRDRRSPKRVPWYRTRWAQKVVADPHEQTKLWMLSDSQSSRAQLKASKHPNTSNRLRLASLHSFAADPAADLHDHECGIHTQIHSLASCRTFVKVMQIRKDMSEQDIFGLGGMLPHYEHVDSNRLTRRKTNQRRCVQEIEIGLVLWA